MCSDASLRKGICSPSIAPQSFHRGLSFPMTIGPSSWAGEEGS